MLMLNTSLKGVVLRCSSCRYVRLEKSRLFSGLWGVVSLNCIRLMESSLIDARKSLVPLYADGHREMMGFPCGNDLVQLDDSDTPLHPALIDKYWRISSPKFQSTPPLARIKRVSVRQSSLADLNRL